MTVCIFFPAMASRSSSSVPCSSINDYFCRPNVALFLRALRPDCSKPHCELHTSLPYCIILTFKWLSMLALCLLHVWSLFCVVLKPWKEDQWPEKEVLSLKKFTVISSLYPGYGKGSFICIHTILLKKGITGLLKTPYSWSQPLVKINKNLSGAHSFLVGNGWWLSWIMVFVSSSVIHSAG